MSPWPFLIACLVLQSISLCLLGAAVYVYKRNPDLADGYRTAGCAFNIAGWAAWGFGFLLTVLK